MRVFWWISGGFLVDFMGFNQETWRFFGHLTIKDGDLVVIG